jgi:hypothetical protein
VHYRVGRSPPAEPDPHPYILFISILILYFHHVRSKAQAAGSGFGPQRLEVVFMAHDCHTAMREPKETLKKQRFRISFWGELQKISP